MAEKSDMRSKGKQCPLSSSSSSSSSNNSNLQEAQIPSLPASCFYMPNFISSEEEHDLASRINSTPRSRWTHLTHRRLLSLPSPLTGTSRDTLLAGPLPPHLSSTILPRFSQLGVFAGSPHGAPNHVLVNEYAPGQGIMPHEDGAAYHPTVATVSLGAAIVLDVYEKNADGGWGQTPSWRILQERRSLLVTMGGMYRSTTHGIAEVEVDEDLGEGTIANWEMLGNRGMFEEGRCARETRISLTYRDVLKVSTLGGAAKFFQKR